MPQTEQFLDDSVDMVSLDLDDSVPDRTSGSTQALQPGGELAERVGGER